MTKGVTFTGKDKKLVDQIKDYQKAKGLKSFTAAVRELCSDALALDKLVNK